MIELDFPLWFFTLVCFFLVYWFGYYRGYKSGLFHGKKAYVEEQIIEMGRPNGEV